MSDSEFIDRLAEICAPQDIDKVRRLGHALVKLAEAADEGVLDAKSMVMVYHMNGMDAGQIADEIERLLRPSRSFQQFQAERQLEKLAEQQRAAVDRRDSDEVDRLESEMDKARRTIETEKEKALEEMKR